MKALSIPFHATATRTPLTVVAALFASWPSEKPIVPDAKGSELASVLLLVSLRECAYRGRFALDVSLSSLSS